MINLQLMKEKKDEISKLNDFLELYLNEQKEKILAIFKSIIKDEYRPSFYAARVVIDSSKDRIIVYAIIKNPVPTEQDDGIMFIFDTSKLEFVDSKKSLYDNLISVNKGYLSL